MKRFFDEHEEYTPDGLAFAGEAGKALKPIIQYWTNMGYSIREMHYLIDSEATILTLDKLIGRKLNDD